MGSFTQMASLTDIGTLGRSFAAATATDLFGDIVGFSNTTGDADVHAFIYTQEGGLQDLNNLIPTNSGWDLNVAQSINLGDDFDRNNARIVSVGVFNRQQHLSSDPNSVGEDLTIAIPAIRAEARDL